MGEKIDYEARARSDVAKVPGFSMLTGKVHRRYVLVVELDVVAEPDYPFNSITSPSEGTDALDRAINYELHSMVPLDWAGTLKSHRHDGITVRKYRKVSSRVMAGTEL